MPKKSVAKALPKKSVAKALPKESVAKALPKKSVAKALPKESVAKALPKKSVAKALPKKYVAKALPKKSVAKALPKKAVAKALPKKSVAKALPKKSVAKAMPKNALVFPDHLTGRRESLAFVADGKLQSPKQLRTQIMRVLELMQAAAWFFARQSPGMKRHLEEPPPPLDYMLTEFSPCVPVRVMCSCVATACRRLATAPAGVHVMYRTTGRWAAWIMERVTRGRVKKVQVRLQRRACCAVRCACRASVVCLTRAAANGGWF
jgi:hypothetical protein